MPNFGIKAKIQTNGKMVESSRIDAYNIKMLNTSNFQMEHMLLATEGRLDSSMGQRRCYNDMNPAKEVVFQAMKKIYLYQKEKDKDVIAFKKI